jgi:hypothetical protein
MSLLSFFHLILECLPTSSGVKDTEWGVTIKAVMKRLRKLATHFHQSSQACEGLKLCCSVLEIPWKKPVQDVVTRWWSTYQLLASLVYLEPAINMYASKLPPELRLTLTDWLICKRAADLLEPFMDVQKVLEGDKYVTGSLCIGMIHDLRVNLEDASAAPAEPLATQEELAAEATLREVAKAMLKIFTDKFGNGTDIVVYTRVRRHSYHSIRLLPVVSCVPIRKRNYKPCLGKMSTVIWKLLFHFRSFVVGPTPAAERFHQEPSSRYRRRPTHQTPLRRSRYGARAGVGHGDRGACASDDGS